MVTTCEYNRIKRAKNKVSTYIHIGDAANNTIKMIIKNIGDFIYEGTYEDERDWELSLEELYKKLNEYKPDTDYLTTKARFVTSERGICGSGLVPEKRETSKEFALSD